MDGGIVISADQRRILYANVLFTPDATIPTNETGTRHKAAEKTAKQLNTLVITISERRKKTTLYYGNSKCYLRPAEEVFREISNTIQLLEKQREIFDELTNKIGLLEITNMVSVSDICKIIQRAEIILRNSETLKKDFIEVGKRLEKENCVEFNKIGDAQVKIFKLEEATQITKAYFEEIL
jgi:diadenylate cyclase